MIDYDKLDAILRERKMSRTALAIKAGISVNNMSSWYRRRTRTIPFTDITAIANVIGLPPRSFVRDDVLKMADKSVLYCPCCGKEINLND